VLEVFVAILLACVAYIIVSALTSVYALALVAAVLVIIVGLTRGGFIHLR